MAKKSDLKKGRLSNKDFETFKKNIHMSDEQLAKKLKRSVSFIEKTRKRVFPNKKTGKWSKADLEMLTENMDKMSIEELARLLNRTEGAVEAKLKSMKPVEEVIEVVETEPEVEKPDVIEEVEAEIFPEEELAPAEETVPEDCCGQDCCEHESKVEEAKEEELSGWKRFWRAFINFFKVW